VVTGEVIAGGGPVLPIGSLGVDADEAAAGDIVMMEDGDGGEDDRCVPAAAGSGLG
jgi:hypothetical protein